MSLDLRPYQTDTYDQARALIKTGSTSILIQSPTGSGKTVLTAKMLKTSAERGYRSWFIVHRRELVKQSVKTLIESADMTPGIVAAGFPGDRHKPVQVCSIATLSRRRNLLLPPQLIVWDEAHHTAAASWAAIHEAYPNAAHIGLTATPERLDGTGLGRWFKELIVGPSVAELIAQGWLCPYKLYAPAAPDLRGVHTLGGDYNKKELSAAMKRSTVTGDAVSHYVRYANGARALLFAWSIESSMEMAAKFNAAGIPAEHVDGDTDDATRDLAMQRFRDGTTRVLTNVDLFGEGVDVPAIEAVILLRPTKSLALYMQQIGRGLRPAPGKDHAVILDHAGNCKVHGLPDDARTWTLEGRRGKPRDQAAPVKQCPMCYAVISAAADVCRHCGHKFITMGREIEEIEGVLEEVKALQRAERLQQQSSAQTLEELIRLGQLRGYKYPERWAKHLYAARLARQMGREASRAIAAGEAI